MLRLELPLPGRPDGVDVRPLLEKEVRRDEGADPPPVAPVLLDGDCARSDGDGLETLPFIPLRSNEGMSPSTVSSSALYRTYGVLGSVIFIWLSFCASVRARFSSSHCKLCWLAPGFGGAFLRIPLGLEFERDIEG